MTEEPKLHVYKFRIDLKEDDVNKCGVLTLIQYSADYCYHVICPKIKCNSSKDLIFGRDNVKEILEKNRYFQVFNRGYLLYPKDTTTNFLYIKHCMLWQIKTFLLVFIFVMRVTITKKYKKHFVWRSTKALLNNSVIAVIK